MSRKPHSQKDLVLPKPRATPKPKAQLDMFAAAALSGLIIKSWSYQEAAEKAYDAAECMLAERQKRNNKEDKS